ncbi:MAG: hypothetical protein WCF94_01390 [bacterium]|jgi:hypothetical protein
MPKTIKGKKVADKEIKKKKVVSEEGEEGEEPKEVDASDEEKELDPDLLDGFLDDEGDSYDDVDNF